MNSNRSMQGQDHRNVAAGEIQRYMTRPTADQLGISEHAGDWWLLDGRMLVVFTFDADRNRTVEVTDDLTRVAEAARWWDLVVANSTVETNHTEESIVA